jgi:hypothetical protein
VRLVGRFGEIIAEEVETDPGFASWYSSVVSVSIESLVEIGEAYIQPSSLNVQGAFHIFTIFSTRSSAFIVRQ